MSDQVIFTINGLLIGSEPSKPIKNQVMLSKMNFFAKPSKTCLKINYLVETSKNQAANN